MEAYRSLGGRQDLSARVSRVARAPVRRPACERDGNAILGVHSLSTQAPIRREGVPPELGDAAASAASYAEWVFRPMEE